MTPRAGAPVGSRLAAHAAAFVSTEGHDMHIAMAGTSRYDDDERQFVPPNFHKSLEELLKRYLPETWACSDTKDTLDPWVALIPNEYGLAVVKTGLAVVFKPAEKSVERRRKIERTFMAIREALTRADPAKRSFRSNQEICVSADHLIRSIVECIEDMILLTSKEKTSWRQKLATAPKFRHRTPPPDPDMILGKLEEALEEFERAIDQPISDNCELADLRQMLQQPNNDLQKCLSYKGKLNTETQGQVQESMLRNSRVLTWLNCLESDLILVDANIDDPGMPKTTPLSVLCATLVTSMVTAHPEDVVVFHFCGQHFLPKDAWYGPNGLVRFLAMQLLVRLLDMKRCDLGFIDDWGFVEGLENHDLSSLCDLLYHLIAQFSAQTTVYCVIDTISLFDNLRTLPDLKTVMDCFHDIVRDTSLSPAVKILCTNPMRSKRTMKQLPIFQDDPTRLVNLITATAAFTSAAPISDRVVGRAISRQSPNSRSRIRGRYGTDLDNTW
ncbi:hypothetical protein KXV92_009726 [Aspergillus fumigatus]|nr:hypothetical protein KXW69_007749 [Aspergillus fumigatus]KAH2380843.1 hypothetical protein KXV62_008601 [Aspergillus fumigatus]KAH3014427.1 hypothetical protein KXW60_008293 [Aspergillus fumigatus]KAH3199102.1 hypothetical protein KXV92_009726 [Aspergillus fumigatus]